MVGRVTQQMIVDRSLTSMQTALGRLAGTQEQLTSGRIINRPSDSPSGTNTAMRLREQAANAAQHARNAQDGIGWLGRADSTLQSMNEQVRRVRGLALQGASTGTSSPEARQALATEATEIRDSLLALANTQHMGRPLFGGVTAKEVAYNDDGTYAGVPGAVNRTVGDGVEVQVNVDGREAFGTGADNLFKILDSVIYNLTNNADGLSANLDQLDGSMSRIQTTLSSVGTRQGRIEDALRLSEDVQLDLRASLSEVENVDIAKAMMNLQMQEVAYQAALGATARVLQPSLLDFLR